ncbi:MAG TPA: VacJ family lipoprotein [Stellaceae bacterium]|nr:VacJ family lipoprotein [Stellaceae bacterium]
MTRRLSRLAVPGLLLLGGLLLSACAAPQRAAGASGFDDPLEHLNRKIFAFNQTVDRHVILPAAKAYRRALPPPARDSIRDFLRNLDTPIIFANDALQGNFPAAGRMLARFTLNSTLGVAGFTDLAGRWGIPYHDDDFGVTLGVWGVGPGPYLVVPVLGPSDPRDLAGNIVDGYADPWDYAASNNGYVWIPFVRGAISGIDTRSRYIETLADLERTSLDYYAAIRALFLQRREALIRHEPTLPPNPGLSRRDNATPDTAAPNSAPAAAVLSEARNGSEVFP